MKTEDQVCSLELAKQLKELGVKQDSVFFWCTIRDAEIEYIDIMRERDIHMKENNYCVEIVRSAFTDAELEREIFQWIENQEVPYDFTIHFSPTGGVWGTETFSEMYEVQLINSLMERAGTGANAKAKMLIHLLKNDLIEK
ncbi:unnamed protein product [marine sediment metagenome]|uniref:Uncharacterized protein n=2 Tax=marine sediment metagenome TaxID=412755 RepID=X1EXX0_9ZZZZ